MPSDKAKKAAADRLDKLDKEADKIERNKLRAEVTMGSRKARRKAATKLSSKPKQFK
jgi:hypothetical protein